MSGFVDPEGARAAADKGRDLRRRLAAALEAERMVAFREAAALDAEDAAQWRASIIGRQAEALIELIDQRIERQLLIRKPLGLRRLAHLLDDLIDRIRHIRPAPREKAEHRDLEALRHKSLDLELARAIFELAQSPFERVIHPANSDPADDAEAKPAAPAAHRLSGASE